MTVDRPTDRLTDQLSGDSSRRIPADDLPDDGLDKMEVTLYPGFNALYYSFYVEGLRRLLRPGTVRVSTDGFPSFGDHCLALRIARAAEPTRQAKIYISASDGPVLAAEGLAWCDLYAKVNLDSDLAAAEDRAKLLAIGPSFPVRVWSPLAAWTTAGLRFAHCRLRGRSVRSAREHFANYRRQYRYRLPETSYRPGVSDPAYLFGAARLWKKETATNRFRANFFTAAKSLTGVVFEGGFIRRTEGEVPGFEEHTVDVNFPLQEFIDRTRRSAVAFNTPAVSGCHGWKLGESLALGKAIVSTPLSRELPAELEHAEAVHIVDGSVESIRDALVRITSDHDYRQQLERGARRYYERFLSPQQVIRRIVRQAMAATF